MIRPISLRLRDDEILADGDEYARLRRCQKHAAYKALAALRTAYQLEEKLSFRFMSELEKQHWRERRKSLEAELKRIAGVGPS